MQKIVCIAFAAVFFTAANAQELYVNTEPASNMATGSIGFRLLTKVFKMNYDNAYSAYRIEPEIMVGAGKKLMLHIAGYGSDMFQKQFRAEGGSVYGKYRFYSSDAVHKHFRLAAFSKISFINNPQQLTVYNKKTNGGSGLPQPDTVVYATNEFDVDGGNSGIVAGVVATKLLNKLAVSASADYGYRLNNINHATLPGQLLNAINYSLSAGYLLFPKEYMNYNQTNINLYAEILGATFPGKKQQYVDVAPSVQVILKSIARLDFSYRTQIAGNMQRLGNSYLLVRLEYNILNAF